MTEGTLNLHERLRQKIGRPSRVESIAIRFTEDELRALTLATERHGLTLREWSREVLLREARRPENDPVFTEIVATRMLLNEILRVLACGQAMDDAAFDELVDEVRVTKHETARQVMELYTTPTEKEN